MDERERGLAFLFAITLPPVLVWFLVAKFTYGIEHTNAKIIIPYLVKNTFALWPLWCALISGWVIGIGSLIGYIIYDNSRVFKGERFKKVYRGTELVRARTLANKTRQRGVDQLTIANIPIPVEVENLHFSISGTTGTGKSTIFNELIFKSIKRGGKNIVLDPNGDFLKKFYRPGDIILNPYDKRTKGWVFFNEIRRSYDYERLVNSIVQESPDMATEEWFGYGRLIFSEVSQKLHSLYSTVTMEETIHWACNVEQKKLKEFLTGTPAEAIFSGSEKAVGSARFILSKNLAPHLKMPEGNFSLRDWLNDERPGTLFITWQEEMKKSLNPLISCWLDSIFSIVLGMGEKDGRINAFIDELESLQYLPNLNDALTKGRKSGLCVFAGYQTFSQLVKVYGRDMAQTILANLRSNIVLGGSRLGEDTLDHMSRSLGEIEGEVERKESDPEKPWIIRKRRDVKVVRAVTPTEISMLPNLTGYLALPGDMPVAKFKAKYVNYKRKNPVPGIELRDI
ncbi:type IV secretion system DNA-binding domain-containing protein [Salmonella enterica subsp. enterica serovar Meleagridis]|nr:type IV secretion system DNA-binding domain-containing protein [Salmonella enterica subsp. enterica serovar Cerro]EGD4263623.1 type IV secretion system DNA-binding domain-containing protein [Salmonella enterica subsp. enterica serovar Cerro]EGD4267974.1 type IV secretion system DNA-binding domain-containing protein [Salmonella enterica subsp. enterica serovar Cerro]EGD4276618.1 type IV secretion system DNA-binding domain-containing protein [Salmonella enterica subsp. enterica serovar Meleagri